ncbi:two-component regulator propeller domain-containing protein [Undibacterium sp. Di24W]|uniref:two-component regulator propeller domain-containing protein n=1 Tax=Undibacterium sp. Di24W TaxID=3413033 RepID=UPI003BF2D24B
MRRYSILLSAVLFRFCFVLRGQLSYLLLATALIIIQINAVARADSIQSLRFSHLTQEHGLPSSSVMSMLQDKQGFMWLGTANGLARYDGRQIKVFGYEEKNTRTISNPLVTALLEDDDAVLWLGTRSGFDRLDLRSETVQRQEIPADISLQNRRVSGIVAGDNKKIWVAMYGGLYQFDTKTRQFTLWKSNDARLQGRIFVIISDMQGGVWLGQGNHVAHIDKNAQLSLVFSTIDMTTARESSTVDLQVRSLAFDAQQRLWVGMEGDLQIWHVDQNRPRRDPLRNQFVLDPVVVRTLLKDSEDSMWIGQGGQSGISKWANGSQKITQYRHSRATPSSLNSGAVQSVIQDSNGSLWVGTSDGGAAQADLRSKRFSLYLNESVGDKNLASPVAMAISFVSDHVAWVGTYSNGLVHLNLDNGEVKKVPDSVMPLSKIKAQLLAPDGKLWIGGDGGLFAFDTQRQVSQEIALNNQLAAGASISSLVLDRNGDLWAGSALGLYRIKNSVGRDVSARYEAKIYRNDRGIAGSLGNDVVDSLLVDDTGKLWVGTKGGLYLWQAATETFLAPIRPDKLVPQPEKLAIQAMRQDQKKRLWLATEIGLFDIAEIQGAWQLRSWLQAKNMPRTGFDSIQDAANGEIWLGNDLGLTRLIPEQNTARFYPALTHFGAGINFGASARGPDGSLYFGTKGLIRFVPEQLRDNLRAPKVVLSDILIFNRSLRSAGTTTKLMDQAEQKSVDGADNLWRKWTNKISGQNPELASLEEVGISGALHLAKQIKLTHKHAMVSFQLSALQYFNRNQNRYAWKLEGSDSDWIEGLGEQGTATYTNLNPGRYQLFAKAANPDGVWSDSTLLLEVEVLPPFWRTWWWYSMVFLAVSSAIFVIYRMRVKRYRANQTYLEHEVTARTAEVVEQREIAERAKQDIALLSAIGREITGSLDSTMIQQVLYQNISKLIESMSFGVGMVDWDKRQIEFRFMVANGKMVEPYQRSLDAAEQPSSQCVLSAKEIKIDEYQFDNRLQDSVNRQYVSANSRGLRHVDESEPPQAKSGIFAPMIVKSKVIGVLCLQSERCYAFTSRDLDILRTLAAYSAIAFDNAEAYQYLQLTQAKLVEQEKLAALGSLVAGVAHELNTPLGNSLLTASTMQEMSSRFLAEVETGKMRRSSLDVFARATETSSTLLVRNLSTASDLITGFKQIAVDQTSDQRRQFDLRTVSEEIALTMSNRIKREEHELKIDMPEVILMDSYPGPFGQVLSNMIMNAIVHAFDERKHGVMSLKAEFIDDRQVRIIFSDNGHGISESNLSKIFDPFFTTRLGQGGSGLGLHICYNIVHSVLGGSIEVRSTIESGTSFEIILPLTAPDR